MSNIDIFNTKFDGSPNYEVVVLGEKLNTQNRQFSVLDLGCGDGRNSFYLSGCNCKIDAVDIDEKNLNRLKYLSKIFNREINTYNQDVTTFRFEKKYDIILSHGLLHFLSATDTENLLNNIVRYTKDEGINMFTTAYYTEGDSVPSSFLEEGHKNEYSVERLKSFYKGWDIILDEDYYKWDYHHSFGVHGHRIQKLITQKPNSNIIFNTFNYEISDITHCNNYNLTSLLNTPRNEVIADYDVQNTIRYFISGPQICFGSFAENGLLLEFDFTQNLLFQSNNNVISGITELKNNFTMIK